MKNSIILLPLAVAVAAVLTLSGCNEEEAEQDIKEAAHKVGEGASQAAQTIEHEAEERGLATPDADDNTGPEDDL